MQMPSQCGTGEALTDDDLVESTHRLDSVRVLRERFIRSPSERSTTLLPDTLLPRSKPSLRLRYWVKVRVVEIGRGCLGDSHSLSCWAEKRLLSSRLNA